MEKKTRQPKTGNSLFDYLFMDFIEPGPEITERGANFPGIGLSPHLDLIMGPYDEEDKFIAIAVTDEEKTIPITLLKKEIKDFNYDNAKECYRQLMKEFLVKFMQELTEFDDACRRELFETIVDIHDLPV